MKGEPQYSRPGKHEPATPPGPMHVSDGDIARQIQIIPCGPRASTCCLNVLYKQSLLRPPAPRRSPATDFFMSPEPQYHVHVHTHTTWGSLGSRTEFNEEGFLRAF